MIVEDIDRRLFAALRFTHGVTGSPVQRALRIDAPGLVLARNLSGWTLVREAVGSGGYTQAFDGPPKLAAQRDYPCRVSDPAGEFLPRSFTLRLPRPTPGIDDDPVAAVDAARTPIELPLLPAAALSAAPAWALLRLAVHIAGSDPPRGLANVWIEARPQVPGKALRLAQTDAAGEALIVVADVGPIVGAAPLSTQFGLELTLLLDPALVRAAPTTDAEQRALPVPDPATLPARRAASRVETVTGLPLLHAGGAGRHVVRLPWPA